MVPLPMPRLCSQGTSQAGVGTAHRRLFGMYLCVQSLHMTALLLATRMVSSAGDMVHRDHASDRRRHASVSSSLRFPVPYWTMVGAAHRAMAVSTMGLGPALSPPRLHHARPTWPRCSRRPRSRCVLSTRRRSDRDYVADKSSCVIVAALLVIVAGTPRLWSSGVGTAIPRRYEGSCRAHAWLITPALYDPGELAGLPLPVQRYFRTGLQAGQPLVAAVQIRHAGQCNLGETQAHWRGFTSSQVTITRPPGFEWDGRISMGLARARVRA